MTSFTQVLKSGVGPKLVPFFKTVAVYFVVFIPVGQSSVFAAVLKCLPVLSLVAFVLLHGMSLGAEYTYSRRILLGLLCSVVGDALLVWDHLFLHGLVAFLVAHLFYLSALGFKPLNTGAAVVVYAIMVAGLAVLLPGIDGPMKTGVLVYALVLMTMVWRAVARVQFFEELWTWTKLCSCAGGILFAVSDCCIAVHCYHTPMSHSQVIIMSTYYAAQLCISLSVVDCKASYLDSLKIARAADSAVVNAAAATDCLDVTSDTDSSVVVSAATVSVSDAPSTDISNSGGSDSSVVVGCKQRGKSALQQESVSAAAAHTDLINKEIYVKCSH